MSRYRIRNESNCGGQDQASDCASKKDPSHYRPKAPDPEEVCSHERQQRDEPAIGNTKNEYEDNQTTDPAIGKPPDHEGERLHKEGKLKHPHRPKAVREPCQKQPADNA